MAALRRRVLLVLLVLGAAVMLLFGPTLALEWWTSLLRPVGSADPQALRVRVPPGSSTRDVAQLLEDSGLIRSALAFRYYARQNHLDGQVKPGIYQLSRSQTVPEILHMLTEGLRLVHKVAVPEGATVAEVADLLAARGAVDREQFLAVARSRNLVGDLVPPGLTWPLEGYLFPATYEIEPDTGAEAVASAMVARFRQAFEPRYQERARQLGLTTHQAVTLAAIVEREARVALERPMIAGVYHNRLQLDMKLDADPTVQYALNKPRGIELTVADLAADHPYNTYQRPGLPPGPIASPGQAALEAALWPDQHRFLFFVAKGDGSGAHRFSATLAEHEEAIALAREEAVATSAR